MTMHVKSEVVAVAKILHDRRLIPIADVVDLLHAIDRKLPDLSFADFVVAVHVAYLQHEPGGRA